MKNHLTLYISGPMTGLPGNNLDAFHSAEKLLREAGFEILNPAHNEPLDGSGSREHYMRADIAMVMQCDGVALLDGWIRSDGAQTEVRVAQELCLPIGSVGFWVSCGQTQQRMMLCQDAMEKLRIAISRDDRAAHPTAYEAYDRAVAFPNTLDVQGPPPVTPDAQCNCNRGSFEWHHVGCPLRLTPKQRAEKAKANQPKPEPPENKIASGWPLRGQVRN